MTCIQIAVALVTMAMLSTASPPKCCSPSIVFLIQHSVFELPSSQVLIKLFMKNTIASSSYAFKCNDISAALIEYGTGVNIRFHLNRYRPTMKLLAHLMTYEPGPGQGDSNGVSMALQYSFGQIMKPKSGFSADSPTKMVFVMKEDPENFRASLWLANKLKQKVEVYIIAIGNDFSESLKQLATSDAHYFNIDHISGLMAICNVIHDNFCSKSTKRVAVRTTTMRSKPTTTASSSDGYCDSRRHHRNTKDHYADPTDCHFFYQCFFINKTMTVGFRRSCPPKMFWHEQILQCLPEGSIECQDSCRDEKVSAHGCYGVSNVCNQYFKCSETGSIASCCSGNTAFDVNSCACVPSTTCNDTCILAEPKSITSRMECVDSSGRTLRTVADRNDLYLVVDKSNHNSELTTEMMCASGSLFDVTTCRCNAAAGVAGKSRSSCSLWLPLDYDAMDHSVSEHRTYIYGDAFHTPAAAVGSGSFEFLGGRIEIPDLKNIDMKKSASFCLHFQCEHESCGSGGLLSNNNDTTMEDYSVVMSTVTNGFLGHLRFSHPDSEASVRASLDENGWNHVCLVYNDSTISLYLNGVNVTPEERASGDLAMVHGPYSVGDDWTTGAFNGLIDDVLVCPFAFEKDDVIAHRDGDRIYLSNNGYIPL